MRAALTTADALNVLIQFAVGLQVIRLATRRGAAHDQQIIVLALLHLIAGTVIGGGLGYGLCFVGLLIVTPAALVLSHLRREVEGNYRQGARDRTGLPVDVPRILRSKRVVGTRFIAVTCLLSIPILLFTISLFIVFPRVGLSLLLLTRNSGQRMIGFSNSVDLGQIGTLRSDPTIALRITYPRLPDPPPKRKLMHLRGTALDHYDGRTWTQSRKLKQTIASDGDLIVMASIPQRDEVPLMEIELNPIDPPVLFLPPHTKALRVEPRPGANLSIQRRPEGEFRYHLNNGRGVRYHIFQSEDGRPTFSHLASEARHRYLELPEHLTQRIRDLAVAWTRDSDNHHQFATIIQKKLRTLYAYDLNSPSGAHKQPLDHFLFESRRGHCEYYSTAMAIMLRSLGVPTRNVTGFVGGTYNKFGDFYAVRQGDAHSWVEAFIRGQGWLTFDPTPPSAAAPQSEVQGALASIRDFLEAISQQWNQHVVGYDIQQQISLFDSLNQKRRYHGRWFPRGQGRYFAAALGIAMAAFCAYWIRRRRRQNDETERGTKSLLSKDAALATRLYRALDKVMVAIGTPRTNSTPPIRHARDLVSEGHPQGLAIFQLTKRYVAARFGSAYFTAQDRRNFEQTLQQLKQTTAQVKRSLPQPTSDITQSD